MIQLVFAVLVLLVIYLVQSTQKPKHYPPGPTWLPFTGSSKEFKRLTKQLGGMHLAAEELSRVYNSDAIGLKLGRENVVIITKYKLIKDILTTDDFNSRPDNYFMRLRCLGTRRGITGIEGPVWHRHRSFLIKHFKTLGFGNKTMEFRIQEELCEIIDVIKLTKQLRIEKVFAPAVLNVLWSITFGSRKERTDKHINKLLDLFDRRSKAFDISGGALSQYPWLRFVAPEKVGYNLIVKLNEELKSFFMDTITEHYKNWTDARNDDFIYSFITEMKQGKDESFNENQLVMICLDIFFGGAATTSNTIGFAFLAMILYPNIQKKMQRLIDEVIDRDKSIRYSDRLRLPYVEAVLLEIQRVYTVAPIAGPRTASFDTVLDEFIIPKNTTVLYSIYSVHMDKEYWGDPEVFRPERFLSAEGKIVHEDRILTFGHGKRRCLGEILARSCLFIFFTEVIRKYSISLASNSLQPKGIPVPGMILMTEEYIAQFIEREVAVSG